MTDFCSYLTALAPYLRMDVCEAWVRQEGGPAGNPLNIGPGQNFGSMQGAAQATAQFLQGSNYAGIRASGGGSAQAQINAIGQSPWDECRYTGGSLATGCNQSCGTPGCTLMNIFNSMFPSGSGSGPSSSSSSGSSGGCSWWDRLNPLSPCNPLGKIAGGITNPIPCPPGFDRGPGGIGCIPSGSIVSGIPNPLDAFKSIKNAADCAANPIKCAQATATGWATAVLPWLIIVGIGFIALIALSHELGSRTVIAQPAPKAA